MLPPAGIWCKWSNFHEPVMLFEPADAVTRYYTGWGLDAGAANCQSEQVVAWTSAVRHEPMMTGIR